MIFGVTILKYLTKVLYQRTTCTAKDPEVGEEKDLETKLDYCHQPVAQRPGGGGGRHYPLDDPKGLATTYPWIVSVLLPFDEPLNKDLNR